MSDSKLKSNAVEKSADKDKAQKTDSIKSERVDGSAAYTDPVRYAFESGEFPYKTKIRLSLIHI